jgi:hypothetical protein
MIFIVAFIVGFSVGVFVYKYLTNRRMAIMEACLETAKAELYRSCWNEQRTGVVSQEEQERLAHLRTAGMTKAIDDMIIMSQAY